MTGARVFSEMLHASFTDALARYIVFSKLAGIPESSKVQSAMHLTKRHGVNRNPTFHTTFLDESLSGHIVDNAHRAHRSTFQKRVLHHNLFVFWPAEH